MTNCFSTGDFDDYAIMPAPVRKHYPILESMNITTSSLACCALLWVGSSTSVASDVGDKTVRHALLSYRRKIIYFGNLFI